MKIYLIRHGRQCSKLCNVNVDLSQEGFRQAALVGERLAKKNIDKVYSSDSPPGSSDSTGSQSVLECGA